MEGIEKLGQQIEKLTREAVTAQRPAVVQMAGEPSHITWLYDFKTGKLDRYLAEPVPRRYQAGGLEAVGTLVNEFAVRPVPGGGPEATEARTIMAFVLAGSVNVVLDEKGDRRERVVMAFQRSPAFSEVVKLASPGCEPLDQREILSLLRTDIAGRYNPDNLIATLKKIRFSSSTEGDSSITTGKASMGRRVEAEVAGLDGTAMDSLETVLITVPVYSDLLNEQGAPIQCTVECHLDIDLAEQTFRLRPKAGELERVWLETDRRIMDDLKTATLPPPADSTASSSTPTRGRVLIVRGVPN